MTTYNNRWAMGRQFRDEQSHFNKFTVDTIQTFFGLRGHWSPVEGAPNWVQPIDEGMGQEYQLIRVNDANEVEKTFPVYVRLKHKEGIHAFAPPDPGKGKGVAVWNHRIETGDLSFWSDDTFKTIICDADGNVHAIPCRMVPMNGRGSSYNQLRMSVEGGELALTPFVVLAFFMWLDEAKPGSEDGAHEVREYLGKIGWKQYASASE